MNYYIYILASGINGVLYVGVTKDLISRVYQHKQGTVEGFTKKYKTNQLVYYEVTEDVVAAIEREKRIKKWNRDWKVRLINKMNPKWNDLYHQLNYGSPTKTFGDDR